MKTCSPHRHSKVKFNFYLSFLGVADKKEREAPTQATWARAGPHIVSKWASAHIHLGEVGPATFLERGLLTTLVEPTGHDQIIILNPLVKFSCSKMRNSI